MKHENIEKFATLLEKECLDQMMVGWNGAQLELVALCRTIREPRNAELKKKLEALYDPDNNIGWSFTSFQDRFNNLIKKVLWRSTNYEVVKDPFSCRWVIIHR